MGSKYRYFVGINMRTPYTMAVLSRNGSIVSLSKMLPGSLDENDLYEGFALVLQTAEHAYEFAGKLSGMCMFHIGADFGKLQSRLAACGITSDAITPDNLLAGLCMEYPNTNERFEKLVQEKAASLFPSVEPDKLMSATLLVAYLAWNTHK